MDACERFMDLISQSLDGPLTAEDQQELQQHLAQCPECRLLAQQFSEIQSELHTWEDQEVPEGFAEGVMARVRALDETPKVIPIWKHPQFKRFGSIAACVLICVGIWRMGASILAEDAVFSGETAAADTAIAYTISAPAASSPQLTAYSTANETDDLLACSPAQAEAAPLSENLEEKRKRTSEDASVLFDQPQTEATFACSREEALIQLVQDTLGELPGTLLVVEQRPEGMEGVWYTAADGSSLFVLDAEPQEAVWKLCVDAALLHVEAGEGPIVFLLTN